MEYVEVHIMILDRNNVMFKHSCIDKCGVEQNLGEHLLARVQYPLKLILSTTVKTI